MALKSVSLPVVVKETNKEMSFTFVPFKVSLERKFTARVTEKLADNFYLMRDTEQLAALYQVEFLFVCSIFIWVKHSSYFSRFLDQ